MIFFKGQIPEIMTEQKSLSEAPVETPVEVSVRTPVETPVKILALLRKNPQMTLAQVAKQIERSVRTAERVAAKLIKEGRLRYVGSKRGGHWKVVEGGE